MYLDNHPEYREAALELIAELNPVLGFEPGRSASQCEQLMAYKVVSRKDHDWRNELEVVKRLLKMNRYYFFVSGTVFGALDQWDLLVAHRDEI